MPRKGAGFDVVRRMGLALSDVEEGTAYGSPALTVRGKMFACLAVHRSAEPNTLAVSIDFDQRDELISEEPKTYYLTDHYVNYPYVLVRLAHIRQDALRDLLLMGWRFVSTTNRDPRSRGGDANNNGRPLNDMNPWFAKAVVLIALHRHGIDPRAAWEAEPGGQGCEESEGTTGSLPADGRLDRILLAYLLDRDTLARLCGLSALPVSLGRRQLFSWHSVFGFFIGPTPTLGPIGR